MIRIQRFSPYGLAVQGHAGAAKGGQDLVCAAVSALVLTLSANVLALEQEKLLSFRRLTLKPGESYISCVPKAGVRPAVELIFDTVLQGLSLLAHLYPKHIIIES